MQHTYNNSIKKYIQKSLSTPVSLGKPRTIVLENRPIHLHMSENEVYLQPLKQGI